MDFFEYQKLAMRTSGRYDNVSEQVKCASLGICGESGELADNVKKMFYHHKSIADITQKKELGDILWYIALYCDAKGWNLNEIAQLNIEKLQLRYPDGFSFQAANAPRNVNDAPENIK